MNNKLKSKTRLTAIQLVSQQLVNNQNIEVLKNDFNKKLLEFTKPQIALLSKEQF